MIDYSKFLRNYFLAVETVDGDILRIQPPFTMEFNIFRNTYSSMNAGTIRLYNLSPLNRSKMRQDPVPVIANRLVKLDAGYGDNLPTIFSGQLTQCWSVREGVNFITELSAFDAREAFTGAKTNLAVPANTPQSSILESFVSDMPNVEMGKVGSSFDGTIGVRGNSYSGNSCDLASELANGQFFIDNGVANFLAPNECLQGQLQAINADSGLIGTPRREQQFVMIDVLFEPRVIVGQYIQLISSTDDSFSGAYKIISINHSGMVSPAVCGDAITTLGLDNNSGSLNII